MKSVRKGKNALTKKKLRFACTLYNESLDVIKQTIDEYREEALKEYRRLQNPSQTELQFQHQSIERLLNEKQNFNSHQVTALEIGVSRYIAQFYMSTTADEKKQTLEVIEYL